MSFTEFYCRSGGSNMNGGGLASGAEPPTSAAYSATNGGWNSGTGVFTPTTGNPSLSASVGDWASVFADGSTTPVFVGRVTAASSTTLTVSTSARSGTAPTTAGSGISINVGGAWKGPNGASAFPFGFLNGNATDAGGDPVRVNLKNDAAYAITAAMTHAVDGTTCFQGYGSAAGDGGKAAIDGGTSGTSYTLLTVSGTGGVSPSLIADLIFRNNGATGSAAGLVIGSATYSHVEVRGVVVHDVRGPGFYFVTQNWAGFECEAYACNQSNTSGAGGFRLVTAGTLKRCVAHDNSGSNNAGFTLDAATGGRGDLFECVADSNGSHGFYIGLGAQARTLAGCDSYNNGGDGFRVDRISFDGTAVLESCNAVANGVASGGYGVNHAGGGNPILRLLNCGFGSGSAANTSGATSGINASWNVGAVTYASGVTPWTDPANGDFRINLAAAKGAGRGTFTQTAASYAGATGYPDIGAVQHQDAGGTTTYVLNQIVNRILINSEDT